MAPQVQAIYRLRGARATASATPPRPAAMAPPARRAALCALGMALVARLPRPAAAQDCCSIIARMACRDDVNCEWNNEAVECRPRGQLEVPCGGGVGGGGSGGGSGLEYVTITVTAAAAHLSGFGPGASGIDDLPLGQVHPGGKSHPWKKYRRPAPRPSPEELR